MQHRWSYWWENLPTHIELHPSTFEESLYQLQSSPTLLKENPELDVEFPKKMELRLGTERYPPVRITIAFEKRHLPILRSRVLSGLLKIEAYSEGAIGEIRS